MRCLLVVVNGLSTQVINKPSALNVALSLHYYIPKGKFPENSVHAQLSTYLAAISSVL